MRQRVVLKVSGQYEHDEADQLGGTDGRTGNMSARPHQRSESQA